MSTFLFSPDDQKAGYGLQPFEERLAELERAAQVDPERLAFFGAVAGRRTHQFYFDRFNRLSKSDAISLLEQAETTQDGYRGAAHNYLTHGLHSYKGKYFPQIVRSLLNAAEVTDAAVVDPFVGSGTTTLEAALMGFTSHGIDRNPLAALIARTKRSALSLDADHVEEQAGAIESLLRKPTPFELPNRAYLERWFLADTLDLITKILGAVEASDTPLPLQDVSRLTLSSLFRRWSLQEPGQLRIHRRETAPDASSLRDRFVADLRQAAKSLAAGIRLIEELGLELGDVAIVEGDARTTEAWGEGRFDALITSPPYATALPYIDTDRLSIYALGLDDVGARSALEWDMIGNREIRKGQRLELENRLDENEDELPNEVVADIRAIKAANEAVGVGFRRENLPALLYRYFADMKAVFAAAERRLVPGALCAVVVGDSYTVAGTDRTRIRTADFLCSIGEQVGFTVQERIPMGGQAAYLPHQRNAIPAEEILLLRTVQA